MRHDSGAASAPIRSKEKKKGVGKGIGPLWLGGVWTADGNHRDVCASVVSNPSLEYPYSLKTLGFPVFYNRVGKTCQAKRCSPSSLSVAIYKAVYFQLTLLRTVVTISTICINIKKQFILPIECIYFSFFFLFLEQIVTSLHGFDILSTLIIFTARCEQNF